MIWLSEKEALSKDQCSFIQSPAPGCITPGHKKPCQVKHYPFCTDAKKYAFHTTDKKPQWRTNHLLMHKKCVPKMFLKYKTASTS